MRTDVVVVGAGKSGAAAARAAAKVGASVLVVDKRAGIPSDLPGDGLPGATAFDLLRAEEGAVAGVHVVRGRAAVAIEARAVVLACGGVAGLWQADAAEATGDAIALAHRAGASLTPLTDLRIEEGRVWIRGGVAADRHGRTSVPGLFATGAATGGEVGGLAAGEWAANHLGPARSVFAPSPSDIDAPLPEAFADDKMERLRRVMRTYLPVEGVRRPDEAFRALHALKGEADDFARCRVDDALYRWRLACEAALLVATSFRG